MNVGNNKNLLELKINDNVTINNSLYDVVCVVKYKDKDSTWVEYDLRGEYESIWLSVEDDANGLKISKHRTIYTSNKIEDKIIYKNEEYLLSSQSNATVVSALGITDTECGELFQIYEYKNIDGKILTIEVWEDSREASVGEYIDETQIVVQQNSKGNYYSGSIGATTYQKSGLKGSNTSLDSTFGYVKDSNKDTKKKSWNKPKINLNWSNIIIWIFWGIIFIPLIISIFGGLGIELFASATKENIENYLKKQGTFTYETSITNSIDESEKATVYATAGTVDATSKLILAEFPSVKDSKPNTDGTSISLLYDEASVLIYLSDDARTLVQVASTKYTHYGNNTLYRPWHYSYNSFLWDHYYFFGYNKGISAYGTSPKYNNYTSTNSFDTTNSTYNNYASSIRSSSLGSRGSSGGGTSFGK